LTALPLVALAKPLTAGPPELGRAEQKAEEGDLTAAAAALLEAEPRISNVNAGTSPAKDHALFVAGRIVARAEKPPFIGFPSDEEQTKWAYLQIKKLREGDDGPELATLFGEIAARLPTERGTALTTLEELEAKGTMASPFGYATLARLRDEAGSGSAALAAAPLRALSSGRRQIALSRCKKTAKRADICEKSLLPVTLPR
jgi:hypothetical protein